MSDKHKKPTTISLVPSVLAFSVSAVVAFSGMFLVMIYNANGGF